MPPKGKAPAEVQVERLPGEEDRVLVGEAQGLLSFRPPADPLDPPPSSPTPELLQPFLRVVLPDEETPRQTPCLTSEEAAAEQQPNGVSFSCELFQRELRPVSEAVLRALLIRDVALELYARKAASAGAEGEEAPEEEKKGKPKAAPKKGGKQAKAAPVESQEEEYLVARAVVSFAALVMGATEDHVVFSAAGGLRQRCALPGLSLLKVSFRCSDPGGERATLLTPLQVCRLMPLCISIVSVTDLPDCRPMALSKGDDDGTRRPLVDKIATQAPDYSLLRAECEGVSLRCTVFPGAEPVQTSPLPHARNLGVYHRRVFLLSDPAQATGGQLTSPLALLQCIFGAQLKVELRDRDRRGGAAAGGWSPHGAAHFSLRPLLFDDAPRPTLKVTEQVCPARLAIDADDAASASPTQEQQQQDEGSRPRRIVPPGQYLHWGTTVTMKVELATRLPSLSFEEAAAVGFDPAAVPPHLAAALPAEPPPEPEAKPGKKAPGSRPGSQAGSRPATHEDSRQHDAPPAAVPVAPAGPVPVFGRLVVVMDYGAPATGKVLRCLLGRLLSFEAATSPADDLQQYQPWRIAKAPKEADAGAPAGKKPAPKGGKGAPQSDEPTVALERVCALETTEHPALRAKLHCSATPRVSGFEVMDGSKRILVFEGLSTVVLRALVEAVHCSCDEHALVSGAVRVVFHKDLCVPLRQYNDWPPLVKVVGEGSAPPPKPKEEEEGGAPADPKKGAAPGRGPPSRGERRKSAAGLAASGDAAAAPAAAPAPAASLPDTDAGGVQGRIRRIRLREGIESIACANRNLRNYARRRLSDRLLRCVDSLRALTRVERMGDALERQLFPSAAQLVDLERVYGTTLSTRDVCGDDVYRPFVAWTTVPPAEQAPPPPPEEDAHAAPPPATALTHSERLAEEVLRANAECAQLCRALQAKPRTAAELALRLGEDLVVYGRPRGPPSGRRSGAGAEQGGEALPIAWLPAELVPAGHPPAAAGGKRVWLDVPAVGSRLLLLLNSAPPPLRSLRLRVQGRLTHAFDPEGRRVLAVQVYCWDEAGTGGMSFSQTRNPAFENSKARRARRLPYTSYRGLLDAERTAEEAERRAKELTRRREEAGESSGSDDEAAGGEQKRLATPPGRPTPDVECDYVWANAQMVGALSPQPPRGASPRPDPEGLAAFPTGTTVQAVPAHVSGALAGLTGTVAAHSEGLALVSFGSQGEVLLSPRQLRVVAPGARPAANTAFKQLSGGWRAAVAADLVLGRPVRVWERGERLGQVPRCGVITEHSMDSVQVTFKFGRTEVVPLAQVEVPAQYPPRYPPPPRSGPAPQLHESLVALAAAHAAAVAMPRWRSRAVASFAFSRPRPEQYKVDTVFADSAGSRDPQGPWRLSGNRGGMLSISRDGSRLRATGEFPVGPALAAALQGGGERLVFSAELREAAAEGRTPPEGLVGDATLRRGLPAVWLGPMGGGKTLWLAMPDHRTMHSAVVAADGTVQHNTSVRPRAHDVTAFKTHKRQDARKDPHMLDRSSGMLHDAPQKAGLGVEQPPLSIHPSNSTPLPVLKPEVSTVYYPSRRNRWYQLDNKPKRPIEPVPEEEKQGPLWGR
eukprot:TRINITY_DN25674_c0_g1_i1.p1 TRINITY_DN25674_c0_g1~~TRINITY_DN25674_c0_g1_i1.p1  ORF type:complete len:1618 (+),score=537.42 TRINITY_DN25674_c0_g1_i1:75-4856(+)